MKLNVQLKNVLFTMCGPLIRFDLTPCTFTQFVKFRRSEVHHFFIVSLLRDSQNESRIVLSVFLYRQSFYVLLVTDVMIRGL